MQDGDLQAFLDGFYLDPDPSLACSALEIADRGKWLEEYPLSLFGFARAVDRYPPVQAAIENLAATKGGHSQAASYVLDTARSISFTETLELPDEPEPGWLDLQWIEFGITGDDNAVERIISVLDWPDIARQRLGVWLHSASGADWNAEPYSGYLHLFARILFPVDIENGTVDGPLDLDLQVVMQVQDGNLKFQELPFEFEDDVAMRAAMKSAAVWSLTVKAQQHPAVARLCDKAAHEAGGAGRFLLANAERSPGQQLS